MNLLQSHGPVLPVLLPAATAILLLLLGDAGGSHHGHHKRLLARRIALASTLLGLALALALMAQADTGAITVYRLGNWPAPFGIVLVLDRLSALMLALTATVALPVLLYASGGWDTHGRYFHVLLQCQLMGLNGAFVTGDLFNLFVFFEVLLVASYVLMLHGGGADRLRAGLPYVVLNLVASALFLVGASLVYATCGTLNLAATANRIGREQGKNAEITFYGASFITGVDGAKLVEAGQHDEEVLTATLDLEANRRTRLNWGVFRDRRPDLYGELLTLDGKHTHASKS